MKPRILIGASILSLGSLVLAEPSEKGRPDPAAPSDGAVMRQRHGGAFQFDPPAGAMSVRIQKSVDDDNMVTTVNEDDREITISQNDQGIQVAIKDGNAETREFAAKDADALKADAPEAWEVYNRYCVSAEKGGGLMMLNDPAGGNIAVRAFPMRAGWIAGLDIRCDVMPNPALRAQLGEGVAVMKVKEGGRGEKIGLKEFDYIRSINGQQVGDLDAIESAIRDAEKLTIEILREGKEVTLNE